MRITFLSPRSNLAGGLRVIAIYARMLRARGHEVTVVIPARAQPGRRQKLRALLHGRHPNPPEPPGHLDDLDLPVIETARADFHVEPEEIPDADAIVATWWETAFAAAAMPPEKGRKFYLIQHHEVHDFLPWQVSRATYYLPLTPIVISNWLDGILRRIYGRDDARLVPNGIDLTQFHAPVRGKAARPTVGFLYSPYPIKGSDTALTALALLRQRFPNLHVVTFGAEPVSPDMPLPPDAEFHLRPAQERIRDIYAACDVFLCASTAEGFFLPLLEAMACRTPLVSTRVGAAEDLIEPGVTGYLADVGDAGALAKGVARILSLSDTEWREMSDRNYQIAQGQGWDRACDLLEAVLTGPERAL
ncbi:glycosyltransferase family 4 protein [Ruegeria sp. WL0004]|uniref:Glycosyltransferase family 4 protein n=1 Tax=Ruegeria marisflavi TaxID=2984152 RepID=A0ABT2WPB0_9RHOB|nr:glycosyltransferase family 4 protein [Ruegeria sp. WL0004]MCU9837676.1 glycosyltransferase family 4 protein [Ruegeria sp. WL0004]